MKMEPQISPPRTKDSLYGWVIVFVAAVAMAATLPGRTHGLGLITKHLLADFPSLTEPDFARINLWATLIGALFCLPCGWLLDRLGMRLVLTVVLGSLAAVVLWMATIRDVTSLVVAITLTRGIGQSMLSVVSITMIGKWFQRNVGMAMGVYAVQMSLLMAAGTGMLSDHINAEGIGWRSGWWLVGIVLAAATPVCAVLACDPRRNSVESLANESPPDAPSATLVQALGSPCFWVFALSISFFGLVSSGISLWQQLILEERSLPASVFRNVLVIGLLVGMVTNLVAGGLAQFVRLSHLLAAAMLLLAGAYVLLPLGAHAWASLRLRGRARSGWRNADRAVFRRLAARVRLGTPGPHSRGRPDADRAGLCGRSADRRRVAIQVGIVQSDLVELCRGVGRVCLGGRLHAGSQRPRGRVARRAHAAVHAFDAGVACMTATAAELAMIGPPPVRATVKFHLSLNVASLDRSVEFFRVLFDRPPAKCRPDYAKFELDEPPVVLSLEPSAQGNGGGALNHLGFRLASSEDLVDWQRRLELAGITSQREEGVECCYARQSKFWVRDPDNNLWEIYVLEEDIEHRGGGQAPDTLLSPLAGERDRASPSKAVWQHQLGTLLPGKIFCLDNSTAEVFLRGSFNVPHTPDSRQQFLSEVHRILQPGGTVSLHMLTGERSIELAKGTLPGPASYVTFVPTRQELLDALAEADFERLETTKHGATPCFAHDGIDMRETMLLARKAGG